MATDWLHDVARVIHEVSMRISVGSSALSLHANAFGSISIAEVSFRLGLKMEALQGNS